MLRDVLVRADVHSFFLQDLLVRAEVLLVVLGDDLLGANVLSFILEAVLPRADVLSFFLQGVLLREDVLSSILQDVLRREEVLSFELEVPFSVLQGVFRREEVLLFILGPDSPRLHVGWRLAPAGWADPAAPSRPLLPLNNAKTGICPTDFYVGDVDCRKYEELRALRQRRFACRLRTNRSLGCDHFGRNYCTTVEQ